MKGVDTMSQELALLGGSKVRTTPFPPHPIITDREKKAVLQVLEEGSLSTFIAAPGEHFLGGARIRRFENEFAEYHGARYAVAFNSGTAALHAAVAGVGVQPGEEVITTPYTFTSTATCALMNNAVPVFADVQADTFCLDPQAVERAINPLTRAVIPVHLFGHPADMASIMAVARKHNLKVIEDCAQAPGATYKGQKVGTIADCAIFSFQESKNMMTGEGGMLITDDEHIAEVARLIRNHGEAVAETMSHRTYASEILGYGYRMTEFEAAIGQVQLQSLDEWNQIRIRLADHLSNGLKRFPALHPPVVAPGCTHVYYVYPFLYDQSKTNIPRDIFAKALMAEGIPLGVGYVKPLYLTPLYQQRQAFAFNYYKGHAKYDRGICPVAEQLHFDELLFTPVCRPPATEEDMNDILVAIEKVFANEEALMELGEKKGTEKSDE